MAGRPAPTVAVRALLPPVGYVKHFDAARVPELWREAGLDPKLAATPEARVPARHLVAMFEKAGEMMGDRHIGHHIALGGDMRRLELFGFVVTHSPDLREAMHRAVRYHRLLSEATRIDTVDAGDEVRVTLSPQPPLDGRSQGIRHLFEVAVGTMVRMFRAWVSPDFAPARVDFSSDPPGGEEELAEYYCCPVRYGQPVTAVVVPSALLALRPKAADPELGSVLVRHAEALLAQLPSAPERWSDKVRARLLEAEPGSAPTLEQIGRALGVSARSLQRRLGEEGTTYAQLEEQLKHELSLRYLRSSELGMAEIAFMLGFNDLSAFYRAFKRWTGTTPAKVRANPPAPPPPPS